MTADYRYPITNSDGTFSNTIEDFDDVFVPQELFLNANLRVWGTALFGGLGLGDTTDRSSPVQVGSLTNWRLVTVGNSSFPHNHGIKTDGTLWGWGAGGNGRLGLGDTTSMSSPVQVGTLTDWKFVSCGGYHSGGIKTDGTLWMWGRNTYGRLGLGDTTQYTVPTKVGTLTNWKQLASGFSYTTCVKTDGTLWTWGYNNFGQLGLGDTTNRSSPVQVGSLTDWKFVSSANYHTACVKTDGTLWIWGRNNYGTLGLGNASTSVSSPVQVGSLTNWKQVSLSLTHSACVKNDGTLWVWGANAYLGQLGLGDGNPRSSPVQVGSLTNWKQVSLHSRQHTACLRTDGTLWTWGNNNRGQLGLGDITNRSSPVQVGSLTNWKLVAGGFYGVACISSDDLPV